MSFDMRKFATTKHSHRTATVAVPHLAPFFAEGVALELQVRGLSGEEVLAVNEAAQRGEQLAALADALAAGSPEAAAKVAEVLGVGDRGEVPVEYSRRLAILEAGCIAPCFNRPEAIHLANNYPTYFLEATTKILELTGLHRIPGKPSGSGETHASASP